MQEYQKRFDAKSVLGIEKTEYRKVICGVYAITCKVNGKVYIGYSKDIYRRWALHARAMSGIGHTNKHLQNDGMKYGVDSFVFDILEVAKTKWEAAARERELIWSYRSCERDIGYNINYT